MSFLLHLHTSFSFGYVCRSPPFNSHFSLHAPLLRYMSLSYNKILVCITNPYSQRFMGNFVIAPYGGCSPRASSEKLMVMDVGYLSLFYGCHFPLFTDLQSHPPLY